MSLQEGKTIAFGSRETREFLRALQLFTQLMRKADAAGVHLDENDEKELIEQLEKYHRMIYG